MKTSHFGVSRSDLHIRLPRLRVVLLPILAAAALSSGGCCKLIPWALAVDPSLSGSSDADGMLEPGETVVVAPTWEKVYGTPQGQPAFSCAVSMTETGTATALTGPVQADYVIGRSAASYGSFGSMSIKPPLTDAPKKNKCANCYEIFVSEPAARPSSHWDATFTETLNGTRSATKTWTLHVGDSFTDVPRSQPFYQKIETLLHKGITLGCAPTRFCPGQDISRGQLATFVAKSITGSAASVPATGTVGDKPYACSDGGVSLFADVAPTDMFCKHIHYVASINVDDGCDSGKFCPAANLTRLQMASFVANALVQPGGDSAVPVTYGPDSTTGFSYSCDPASPNSHFSDLPVTDPLCKSANYLWARGVISGCSATEYCPSGEVTRDQMAKFLVNAFKVKLTLYGP